MLVKVIILKERQKQQRKNRGPFSKGKQSGSLVFVLLKRDVTC